MQLDRYEPHETRTKCECPSCVADRFEAGLWDYGYSLTNTFSPVALKAALTMLYRNQPPQYN